MFKLKDILEVANELNIDFTKFSLSDFITGINIELEHGLVNPQTNVSNDNLLITAKIALLSLGILFLLIAISSAICVISINNIICNKFKIEKTIVKFGILVASSIVIWLLTLIPYVGGLISFVLTILGLGIVIINIIPIKVKKEKVVEENKEN